MIWRIALVLAGLALCASQFVPKTLAAERIRAEGTDVLLPLAPVDPRALLLGDYMQLNYDRSAFPPYDAPGRGTAVLRDTEDGPNFVRIHEGGALADGEFLMRFSPKSDWGRRHTYGGERYYFQSGTAERYRDAEYGIFRVMPDGRALLMGLADAERKPIAIVGKTEFKK